MNETDFDAEAFVDQMAAAVGIVIEAAYRDAVVAAMRANYEGARLLFELDLDDTAEPAGVYVP